jgi:hypothetical protein
VLPGLEVAFELIKDVCVGVELEAGAHNLIKDYECREFSD